MIEPKTLTSELKRNQWVIMRQLEGLSHEDSLLQLPFRGNCMNWVIGHILESRNTMLTLLSQEPFWDQATRDIYRADSEPITSGDNAVNLDQMRADLEGSEKQLTSLLEGVSVADLNAPVGEGDHQSTVGKRLKFLTWHEAYHTGQTEILRQLAGTDDKII